MSILNGAAREYDNHRMISFVSDPKTGLQAIVAIHRGSTAVPAFGATRLAHYDNIHEAIAEAMRLSKLMSYKAALAGLKYGGAKGVILAPRNTANMGDIFKAYADKVNFFDGHFITGADVGVSQADVKLMQKHSKSFVGVTVDPVKYTALGLLAGVRVALKEVFDTPGLSGRKFAIQGVGKIGSAFLDLIYKEAGTIYIADVDFVQLKKIKRQFPKVQVVTPTEIYKQEVDVFAPCALSNALTPKTIAKLKAKIVAGGANNQLESASVGELLHKLGILYAPDYVINAGGLISVVDEYEHKSINRERLEKRVQNIGKTLHKIFAMSKKTGKATNLVADALAEKIFNNH
jgi:leucine dehydrogenase